MDLELRAARHAALSDVGRLHIVDELSSTDLTVADLGRRVGMPTNLLAHHLGVLEDAGLISRRVSEGDHRRRYVRLNWTQLPYGLVPVDAPAGSVVFVCTHNSARSQFAAELWRQVTGAAGVSAGTEPASIVNPKAVRVADEFGIDLSGATPAGYESLPATPDLVISVCDRAFESGTPSARRQIHWSVPDPVVGGRLDDFRAAFADIAGRVDRLADNRS